MSINKYGRGHRGPAGMKKKTLKQTTKKKIENDFEDWHKNKSLEISNRVLKKKLLEQHSGDSRRTIPVSVCNFSSACKGQNSSP